MRITVMTILALIGLALAARTADGQQPRRRGDDGSLTVAQVDAVATARAHEIRECYDAFGKTARKSRGAVELVVTIHRDGNIHDLTINAPGITNPKFFRCVRKSVESWRFPSRRNFSDARIPYLFLNTKAPGAGPTRSCWSARGCPSKKKHKSRRKPVNKS